MPLMRLFNERVLRSVRSEHRKASPMIYRCFGYAGFIDTSIGLGMADRQFRIHCRRLAALFMRNLWCD